MGVGRARARRTRSSSHRRGGLGSGHRRTRRRAGRSLGAVSQTGCVVPRTVRRDLQAPGRVPRRASHGALCLRADARPRPPGALRGHRDRRRRDRARAQRQRRVRVRPDLLLPALSAPPWPTSRRSRNRGSRTAARRSARSRSGCGRPERDTREKAEPEDRRTENVKFSVPLTQLAASGAQYPPGLSWQGVAARRSNGS